MADGPVYEVSHIVEEKWSNPNNREFKVRWVGYTSDDDTWEPMENLADGASHVIREWDRQRKMLAKRKAKEGDADSKQPKRERSASQTTLRQQSMDSFVQKPRPVQTGTPLVKVVLILTIKPVSDIRPRLSMLWRRTLY
jgi:Chromo (CHRromatin Organisation MOdifier) domain